MKKLVAIIGIDSFLKKNFSQIKCLNKNDVTVEILTNDTMKTSLSNIDILNSQVEKNNKIILLKNNFFTRFKQIYSYLKYHKSNLNHIEVYPGGRFTFIYVLLANFIGVKTICIERGDIGTLDRSGVFISLSMKLTYKFSNLVIYKEFYMKKKLQKLNIKNIVLLYNCVETPLKLEQIASYNRPYTFLWANRLVKERKIEWIVDLVEQRRLITSINILGILNNKNKDKDIQKNINLVKCIEKFENVYIHEYVKPEPFYNKTKFFLLPSDIVFVNNALLEAMSYGMIPLISNVSGAKKIVEDGIDGLIFEHTKEGFQKAIKRALALSDDEVYNMSFSARKKVERVFSCDSWGKRYLKIISTNI